EEAVPKGVKYEQGIINSLKSKTEVKTVWRMSFVHSERTISFCVFYMKTHEAAERTKPFPEKR
ncbi:hypothetical protein ACQKI4_05865, partial [Paenibacillus glucanolyticus]|uniref:hypothetical protein n=1 Tax=Paenibacillus glucanolyticus TaxID=59843 RepID=UPI003D089BE8